MTWWFFWHQLGKYPGWWTQISIALDQLENLRGWGKFSVNKGMIQEIGLFLIVFHSVLSTSTKWGTSCWISSIQITEFFGQLPPLGWRTVWVRQGFSFLIVKVCLGNSDSISCFIASSTVNLPMVALPRCCCSAIQSIFCSYQTTDVFVKPLGWLWSCLFMIVIFNLVSYERFHLLKAGPPLRLF